MNIKKAIKKIIGDDVELVDIYNDKTRIYELH